MRWLTPFLSSGALKNSLIILSDSKIKAWACDIVFYGENGLIRGFMKKSLTLMLKEAWVDSTCWLLFMDSRACYHSTAIFYLGTNLSFSPFTFIFFLHDFLGFPVLFTRYIHKFSWPWFVIRADAWFLEGYRYFWWFFWRSFLYYLRIHVFLGYVTSFCILL